MPKWDGEEVHLSLFNTFFVYVSYTILLFFGHWRDLWDYLSGVKTYETPAVRFKTHNITSPHTLTHLHGF